MLSSLILAPLLSTLALQAEATPSTPAPASPAPVRDVPAILAKADAAMAALDDESARDLLQPLMDDPTVPPFLRGAAALKLGVAEANLLRPQQAQAAFKRALGDNPAAALPSDASPKAQELFAAARMELVQSSAPKPPTALPPKEKPEQKPVLGWVRPTSVALLISGGGLIAIGGAVAVAAAVLRQAILRWMEDPVQKTEWSRWLLPMGLAAAGAIILAIPVAGLGLALFFLSGEDGPLRAHVPSDTEP